MRTYVGLKYMAAGLVGMVMLFAGCNKAPAPPAPAASAVSYSKNDLLLFRAKCSRCHKWTRPIVRLVGKTPERRAAIIKNMQERAREKIPGWISDDDAKTITKLLSTNNLSDLKAAVDALDQK